MIRGSIEFSKPVSLANVVDTEGLINVVLSPEMIQNIFSYSSNAEIQAANSTCTLWNEMTVEWAMHKNYGNMKKAAEFFYKHLNGATYGLEQQALYNLSILQVPSVNNLIAVQSSVDALAENILSQLKKVSAKDLKTLFDGVSPWPSMIKTFLSGAYIYQRLDLANLIEDDNQKYSDMRSYIEQLAKIGNFNKAIEIANSILSDDWKAASLYAIFEVLINKNRVFKALELAHSMPNDEEDFKGQAIDKVMNILVERRDFPAALKIVENMTDEGMKKHYTKKIIKASSAKGAQGYTERDSKIGI